MGTLNQATNHEQPENKRTRSVDFCFAKKLIK